MDTTPGEEPIKPSRPWDPVRAWRYYRRKGLKQTKRKMRQNEEFRKAFTQVLDILYPEKVAKPLPVKPIKRPTPTVPRRWKAPDTMLIVPPNTKIVTPEELATELQVTRQTVMRWARARRIPSVKIAHGLVRFDLGQVQQMLLKGRDGGAP
jgi:excisionase family DNA binding protein